MISKTLLACTITFAALLTAAPENAQAKNLCKVFCGTAAKTGAVSPKLLRNPNVFVPKGGSLTVSRHALRTTVPQEARDLLTKLKTQRGWPRTAGSAPQGTKGRGVYRNETRPYHQKLPEFDHSGQISYFEYDLFRKVKDVNRGAHRLVVGTNGRAYYTNNHYVTFTEVK